MEELRRRTLNSIPVHARQGDEASGSRRGERAGRASHFRPVRGREAGHDRDRAHPRRGGSAAAAQARLVAERAAADPRQPAYRGLVRWNGETHPGLHEPLVDDDTFDKAQEILRRRGEDASLRRGNPSDFLLSGLVRCHHCGRAYVGTSAHGRNGRYTYYACSTRYKYGPAKCQGDRLPKDSLEAAVLTQLAELYRDGHVIEKALANLAEATETERPQVEEQLAATRAEITRVEGKLERYFEGFEDGRLAADLPRPSPWPP